MLLAFFVLSKVLVKGILIDKVINSNLLNQKQFANVKFLASFVQILLVRLYKFVGRKTDHKKLIQLDIKKGNYIHKNSGNYDAVSDLLFPFDMLDRFYIRNKAHTKIFRDMIDDLCGQLLDYAFELAYVIELDVNE